MSAGEIPREFREYSAHKLGDHFAQIRRCASLLSEEQLWFRPNERSNSIANLLLHLTGNLRQWMVGGLGGQAIERHRQGEFDARGGPSREQLLQGLSRVVDEVTGLIRGLTDDALGRRYRIQEYDVSGVAAVLHIVEHFAYHTGQIVTTTKWLLDVDLSLYDEKGHRHDGRASGVP